MTLFNTVLPISGIIHIFGFFVMFFLAFRFLRYGESKDNIIGKFFGYGFFFIALSRFFLGFPSLFFLKNQNAWIIFELIERFFLLLGLVILGYIIYFVKFPKYVKKITIFFIFISIVVMVGFIINPPTTFVSEKGVLIWENPPLVASILNFLMIVSILIPGIIVFFKEARSAEVKKVKIRAIGMASAMAIVFIPGFLDFFILPAFKLNPLYSEFTYFIFYLILAMIIILTYSATDRE
ncbi:MAG: hypothetical protein PHI88_01250 [Candidatus Pacebacteria bacterium]|nr:hypothetical protein [Candidatus Paceibacterota bacterium]